MVPTTTRDLTQALYVAAIALGRTRDAEEVVRAAIAGAPCLVCEGPRCLS